MFVLVEYWFYKLFIYLLCYFCVKIDCIVVIRFLEFGKKKVICFIYFSLEINEIWIIVVMIKGRLNFF